MHQLVLLITTEVYIHSDIHRKATEYTAYLAKTKLLVSHHNTSASFIQTLEMLNALSPYPSKPLAESSSVLKLYKRGVCNFLQLVCQARFPCFPSLGKSGARMMAALRLLDEFSHQQRLRTHTQGKHSSQSDFHHWSN